VKRPMMLAIHNNKRRQSKMPIARVGKSWLPPLELYENAPSLYPSSIDGEGRGGGDFPASLCPIRAWLLDGNQVVSTIFILHYM